MKNIVAYPFLMTGAIITAIGIFIRGDVPVEFLQKWIKNISIEEGKKKWERYENEKQDH